MRKISKLLSVILLIGTLLGCSSKATKTESYIADASFANMSEYTELESNDGFKSITKEQLISAIGDETVNAIIYMGYPGCSNCQSAIKGIQTAALDADQTIYYFNCSTEIETDEDYDEVYEALKDILISMNEDDASDISIYTPHVFLIVKGQLYRGFVGYREDYDYSKLMDIDTIAKEYFED